MTVKVNRTIIDIFQGATARHAVLRYLAVRHRSLKLVDTLEVRDEHGHIIDLDAPLAENKIIKCRVK